MKTFRTIIFWMHLVAGVIAGVAIGIMCFTGTALAFEKELAAWAERDARMIAAPAAGAARLSIDEIQARLLEAKPDAKPATLVLQNDPLAAVGFPAGRSAGYYVNPHTGEVKEPASFAMGRFMQSMLNWHRYLNLTAEQTRPRGKLINGICNVAFCVLGVTGLYLWMPRSWSWRALRPSIWFTQNRSSKARDWNWHNAIGFWSAPVLIVLTLTAMPISFRWAGNFLYTLTGTPLPASGPASSGTPPAPASSGASVGGDLQNFQALVETAQKEMPTWQTLTLRLPANDKARQQPISIIIREAGSWPRTATTTLQLDPRTGAVLKRDGHADLDAARRLRGWTRYLHTGEAVGFIGQVLAALASLGGCVLVYTGLALAWRRFFGRKPTKSEQ